MPPEKVFANRSAASSSANRDNRSAARARADELDIPWIRPARTRFSRAVAIGSLDAFCETSPMMCRTAVGVTKDVDAGDACMP